MTLHLCLIKLSYIAIAINVAYILTEQVCISKISAYVSIHTMPQDNPFSTITYNVRNAYLP